MDDVEFREQVEYYLDEAELYDGYIPFAERTEDIPPISAKAPLPL